MKTIILVRHGKSSWEFDVRDQERPLKKRGVNDANKVSQEFKKIEYFPDLIISSPANRALSTCKIFMKNLDYPEKALLVSEKIYDFGGNSVLNLIKELDDGHQKIMIFGHNHAFTSISNLLGNNYIDNLPTSGLVMININIDSWKDLERGETQLTIFPRDLK